MKSIPINQLTLFCLSIKQKQTPKRSALIDINEIYCADRPNKYTNHVGATE